MPGWFLAGRAWTIARTFQVPDDADALAFLSFVTRVSKARGRAPGVFLDRGKVTVTLPLRQVGRLDPPDFELAQALDFPGRAGTSEC